MCGTTVLSINISWRRSGVVMMLGNRSMWQLAIAWTKSNRVLIRCVAAQYLPYMGCSLQDLESEALLTAYQTLAGLLQNEKDLTLMGRYFRVVFRSRCIELTMGVNVVADCDMARIYVTQDKNVADEELDPGVIEAALSALTGRQRQVAQWILNQPTPVNADMVGQQFGITARGVRRLINCAISRIENGHRRVCQNVSAHP